VRNVLDNVRTLLPFLIFSWAFFAVTVLWRPQRFSNCIFLGVALLVSVIFLTGLAGDYQGRALVAVFLLCVVAIFAVPVMLIMNGVTMLRRESRSVGNLLSLILGIVIGIGEILFVVSLLTELPAIDLQQLAMPMTVIWVTVFYFSCWILTFVLYVLFIQWMPHRMQFDYVIIHGSGLIGGDGIGRLLGNRIDKAIEIYHKCKVKPMLIPSGGKGGDETVSEAEAMKKYLLEHGIPEQAILTEDGSATTMENLQNSMKLIVEHSGKQITKGCRYVGKQPGSRTALISSNYHIYRCLLYAAKLKFHCVGIGAKVAWYYWPSATLREFVAVFTKMPHVFWMFGGYLLVVVLPTLAVVFGS